MHARRQLWQGRHALIMKSHGRLRMLTREPGATSELAAAGQAVTAARGNVSRLLGTPARESAHQPGQVLKHGHVLRAALGTVSISVGSAPETARSPARQTLLCC